MRSHNTRVTETVKSAMDEKAAKYVLDALEDGRMVISLEACRDGFGIMQEPNYGAVLAIVWYPVADGNPYGDVEVSDRLLEQMGM